MLGKKNSMKRFLIRDIESLTGIKSHTLRIWEQRYKLCCPKRTDTNIRFYDDEDLRLLLNISVLNDNGYKISEIAKMPRQEIYKLVSGLTEDCANYGCQIRSLCNAMLNMDEYAFEKTLNTNILKMGLENTMCRIVFPLLQRIGIMWQTGTINPAHEHFVSHLIRQKLMVAIDGLAPEQSSGAKKFILFLIEGERHELGLLYANYIIRSRGFRVLYLGQGLSCSDLYPIIDTYQPDYLFSAITSAPGNDIQALINKLCYKINLPVLLTGYQVLNHELQLPPNVVIVKDTAALLEYIEKVLV